MAKKSEDDDDNDEDWHDEKRDKGTVKLLNLAGIKVGA